MSLITESISGRTSTGSTPSWAKSQNDLAHATALPLCLAVAFSLLAQHGAWDESKLYLITNVIVTASLVVAGVIVDELTGERKLSLSLIGGGFFWSYQFFGTWDRSVMPLMAFMGNASFYMVTAWGIVNYPQRLPTTQWERRFIRALWLMPVTQVLVAVTTNPNQDGFSQSVVWPSVFVTHNASTTVDVASYLSMLVLAIAFVFIVRNRLQRMTGIDQLITRPLAIGFCIVALVSGISEGDQFFPGAHLSSYFFKIALASLCIPTGFVFVMLKHRLHHAHTAATIHGALATRGQELTNVLDALRIALNDDSINVAFWLPNSAEYVNHLGASFKPDRHQIVLERVVDRNNNDLALVYGDESVRRHSDVLHTAVAASAMALENAQLHASVLSQLEEVRLSRSRIAEAAISERRRIERDLHDGVQQRMLALAMRVGTAERRNKSAQDLAWIREEILATLGEVRDLAHGIHPTELRQFGLKTAVESIALNFPFDVKVGGPDRRFPENIEATAYFVVCEALANVVKHANASEALVEIGDDANQLLVAVLDNGNGRASIDNGTGLRGLVDRVAALGGTLEVTTNSSGGTTIKTTIPCA